MHDVPHLSLSPLLVIGCFPQNVVVEYSIKTFTVARDVPLNAVFPPQASDVPLYVIDDMPLLWNAFSPILVTVDSNIDDVNALQLQKADVPIDVTPPHVTDDNTVHP